MTREAVLTVASPFLIATVDATNPLWERLLEKWGIAFVMFLIFWLYAKRTTKREDEEQKKRDKAEAAAQAKRDAEEKADREERLLLLSRIAELTEQQLKMQREHITAQAKHSHDLKALQRDSTKAIQDAEAAHRMLTRRLIRPCVAPLPVQPTTTEDSQ